MGAVWVRSKAELRRRWGAWLVVMLLAGIGGGIVMGAFAGAYRVEHTYPNFAAAADPMDVLVPGASTFGLVGGVEPHRGGPAARGGRDGRRQRRAPLRRAHCRTASSSVPATCSRWPPRGTPLGSTFERWTMLDGRAAHPWAVQEATASFLAAEQLHLKVGDEVKIHFFAAKNFLATAGSLITQFTDRLNSPRRENAADYARFADGPELTFKIVGIEASPAEFPPLPADISPPLHLTRAFYEKWNDKIVQSPLLYTRLKRGHADLPSFERQVERMGGDQPVAFVTTRATQNARVQRAIQLQATALRIFAVIVLAAFLVLLEQAISRQVRVESEDDADPARGSGCRAARSWRCRWSGPGWPRCRPRSSGRASPSCSRRSGVIGLARKADPQPGLHGRGHGPGDRDRRGGGPGVPLLTLWPAYRRARNARSHPGRATRPAGRRAPRGVRPPRGAAAHVGRRRLRHGPRPRAPSAIPIHSAIVGFTLGIGLLVATLGFGGEPAAAARHPAPLRLDLGREERRARRCPTSATS